jgi:hypothetical protein
MSHHFDTPTAKEDPRINICDFYLFRGRDRLSRHDLSGLRNLLFPRLSVLTDAAA